MEKRRGYLKVAEIRGVTVLVHWSFPTGGLIISLLGHADPKEWVYFCVGFTLLVVMHECGHVLMAVGLGLKVFTVEISGVGGRCRCEAPSRIRDSFLVYAAGLFAQIVVFLVALAYLWLFGAPHSVFGNILLIVLTFVNVGMFVINLIPQRDARSGLATDGSVLWRLLLHVLRGHPHPHPPLFIAPPEQSPVFPSDTRLVDKPNFRPPGFVHGIEIFNDTTTPMEVVVSVLTTHLGLSRDEAITKMLDIHNTGGAVVAFPTEQEARRVAEAISADARAAGHTLICRYADTQ